MIEIFEKKGIVRILLILQEHQDQHFSKYELEKVSGLSTMTVYRNLKLLKGLNIIAETPKVGPRGRTEIQLTTYGKEISHHLSEIKMILQKLEKNT